ncbi:Uncharacterised protein [uncultured archaeon]|nr:Uncharacterised protein [uncultured archaeon]
MNELLKKTAESQISRAKELFKELTAQLEQDINKGNISTRASELTEETLIKAGVCLDKCINLYSEAKGFPESTSLYFPIAKDKPSFDEKTNKPEIKKLITANQKVYDILLTHQPFIDTKNSVLSEIQKENREKHRKLTLQDIKVVDERISFNGPGGGVTWSRTGVRFGNGVSINGVPINPATQLPAFTPPTHKLTINKIVTINFQGTNVDVIKVCKEAIDKVEAVTKDFITLS